MRRLR
jgi:hypothetical protein